MSDQPYALFVPFNPDPDSAWLLRRRVTPVAQFDTQVDAIQAAHEQVAALDAAQAIEAVVMVQSEDGSWRCHDGEGVSEQVPPTSALPVVG